MKSILFLMFIFLSGCLIRTYTIQKPRVDLDIKGNQGYIYGNPPEIKRESKLSDKRTISVVEIELGPHRVGELKETKPVKETEEIEKLQPKKEEEIEEKIESTGEKKYKYYVVRANDTLQKVSYKFYGTTKKWKMLYEENKDVIKNPDKIYPGTKIKIPIE